MVTNNIPHHSIEMGWFQLATPAADDLDDLMINAAAERALFVEMLTRDIELIPAIMDLIDNSIDGARALSDGDLAPFAVELEVSSDRFHVSDNCGGIELDVARRYAFRFGRPEAYKGTKRSVGQFGVGMKRALFKLGNQFSVDSRAETTSFFLDVPVDEWVDDDDPIWTFHMTRASRKYDSSAGGRGTTIEVSRLHESVSEDLGSPRFHSLLRDQIRFRHQAALADGLTITLNGEKLKGFDRELLAGPDFGPINRTFVVSTDEGDDVAVRIVAGIVAVERRDAAKDDGDAENFNTAGDAGWWVFCNDRLLLMRDRTDLTGWGVNLPAFHPQYRQFRGYVYMSAANTAALPWNTTKTGVDEESRVWRQVQAQIKISGAQVVSVLNRLKTEAQTATTDADMPAVLAASSASMTKTESLPPRETFAVPPPKPPARREGPKKPRTKHLQYDVPLAQFVAVAEHLETTVVAAVGRKTFDYYFEREISD